MGTPLGFASHSTGFRRQSMVDGSHGSVHTSFGVCALEGEGQVDAHVHSFEESFYVIEGNPLLDIGGETVQLGSDRCGLIPVGTVHSWRNPGPAPCRWLEAQAPRARGADDPAPADTFFVPEEAGGSARPVDLRDPRNQRFFRLDEGQMEVDRLKVGSTVGDPQVSASMATALLAYSGITVKMLIDARLGAALHTISGERCNPHPHVFSDRLLRPGDQAFFDIIHSFMGYRTCYYRTFCVGGATQSQIDAYKQCREWLDAAMDLVRPGTTTDQIAAVWPTAEDLGFANEEACFGLQFGHGIGVGLYEPPMISRLHSFEDPIEIEEGMVFALETYCPATDGRSAARIEEEVVVTAEGHDLLTRFPAEELLVAGRVYVRGADLVKPEGAAVADEGNSQPTA